MAKIGSYYRLTKPGIIYGNALAGLAGFGLAISGTWDIAVLLYFMAGLCLVIAAGCVANNIIDRSIDARMARTKKRAIVTGEISITQASLYAVLLGVIGFGLLAYGTNMLTVLVGCVALLDYIVLYAIAKRYTSLSTVVGSISGALPPVGGYVALSGTIDMNSLLLFAAMVLWQMPHFYAIGLYRGTDYKAAGLPLLTLRAPRKTIWFQCVLYAALYIVTNILLWRFGDASTTFVLVMSAFGVWWLREIIMGIRLAYSDNWARHMFKQSLYVLAAWCGLLVLNNWLP